MLAVVPADHLQPPGPVLAAAGGRDRAGGGGRARLVVVVALPADRQRRPVGVQQPFGSQVPGPAGVRGQRAGSVRRCGRRALIGCGGRRRGGGPGGFRCSGCGGRPAGGAVRLRVWPGLSGGARGGVRAGGGFRAGTAGRGVAGDVGEHTRPGSGVLGSGLGAAGQAGGGADEGVECLPEFRGTVLFGGEVAGQGSAGLRPGGEPAGDLLRVAGERFVPADADGLVGGVEGERVWPGSVLGVGSHDVIAGRGPGQRPVVADGLGVVASRLAYAGVGICGGQPLGRESRRCRRERRGRVRMVKERCAWRRSAVRLVTRRLRVLKVQGLGRYQAFRLPDQRNPWSCRSRRSW